MLTGFQQILQQLRVQAPFSGFTRTGLGRSRQFRHPRQPARSFLTAVAQRWCSRSAPVVEFPTREGSIA